MAIAAIACGAIYVVVSPPQPLIKRTESRPPSVLLPYEQQITRKSDAPAAPQESAPQDHAIAPAETTPAAAASAKAAPDEATAPKPDAQAAAPAEEGAGAPADGSAQENAGNPDAAGMPPGEDADANNDGRAMPPDNGGAPDQAVLPPDDGSGQYDGSDQYDVTAVPPGAAPPGAPYGNAPYGPPPNAYAPPQKGPPGPAPYGPPPQGGPYGQAPQGGPYDQPPQGEPYGQAPDDAAQGAPGEPQEEWVQVLVSGAGMYGTASEDAPMLFAFPYGRRLRVVSHYEGWVEVTDPQSATTGWMKTGHLAPIAAPGAPQQVEAGYEEERPGWFRRQRGGLGDIISRALGGF